MCVVVWCGPRGAYELASSLNGAVFPLTINHFFSLEHKNVEFRNLCEYACARWSRRWWWSSGGGG